MPFADVINDTLGDVCADVGAVFAAVTFVAHFEVLLGIVVSGFINGELDWYVDYFHGERERSPLRGPRLTIGRTTMVEFDLNDGRTLVWDLAAQPIAEA